MLVVLNLYGETRVSELRNLRGMGELLIVDEIVKIRALSVGMRMCVYELREFEAETKTGIIGKSVDLK